MKKILLIDTVHPVFTEELEAAGFVCTDGTKYPEEQVLEEIPAYEGLQIRSRIRIDRKFIDRATGLKFIARAGAGMESIDEVYALEKGIACLSAPEGNRDAVGEHAVGMLLTLFNRLHIADREVREGAWKREPNRGVELQGKTVGIIGYGNMGSAFARRLSGFGVKVLAYDKYKKGFSDAYAQEASMEEVFKEAEVVSLHLPLTSETHYLVSDAFIRSFRKPFYLINTARGKIVNTGDLVRHLEEGKIKGACLDVLEYESHSFERFSDQGMPEPYRYLAGSDTVLLSPHIAGWTHESRMKIAQVLAEKIKQLYR
jgi:D-3-phosphoglycerate dehydrogenase / 2-oxoglutarate reductase